jgi:hypothetical protein
MRKNINSFFGDKIRCLSIFLLILLITFSCTLKSGKNLNNTNMFGIGQHNKYVLNEDERKSLKGEKINFSELSYYWNDGTIQNQKINSTIIFDNKVFDISTKEPVKHFPFTILIQSFGKSDSGIAINLETNNFIRKAFLKKDLSSLIAHTVKQPSSTNKQVLKMVFRK